MIITIYVMAILVSIINMILLVQVQKRGNVQFGFIFSLIFFANVGYLVMITANTPEVAMLGNKIAYMGGLYLPVFICMIILNLSGIKRWVQACYLIPMFFCSTLILMMVLFYEWGDFYYLSVEMIKKNGITYISKEHGWGYSLHLLLLLSYVIVNLVLIIYILRKKRRVSYKNMVYLLMVNVLSILFYFVQELINLRVDIMPCVYTLDGIALLLLIRRIQMYDVSATVSSTLEENSGYGYVTFDHKCNYLNSNRVAKEKFPELRKLRVDHTIAAVGRLTAHIVKWLEAYQANPQKDEHYFEHEGAEYKCMIRPLLYGGEKTRGYIVEILDDTKQQEYIRLLNNYNEELERDVAEQTTRVLTIQNQMVLGMANMVENRDFNTGGHIKRTSEVIEILVDEWKKDMPQNDPEFEEFCTNVVKAAPMHDLGKIAVEDRILRKPGKYTEEEYALMKVHSEIGGKIVETVLMGVEDRKFVRIAKNIAHYHHERWDGTGYPKRLKGEEIPLEARIMALADVYDALISRRCYKEKMGYEDAFRIMVESMGTHFDPELGKVFIRCREKLESYYERVDCVQEGCGY